MSDVFEVSVPWVPPKDANPNDHHNSERTKIRRRKAGASDSVLAIRAARMAVGDGPLFTTPVYLDIEIRWPAERRIGRLWDSDAVVTCFKYVRDVLEKEGVVANDSLIQVGTVTQVKKCALAESVLRLREVVS